MRDQTHSPERLLQHLLREPRALIEAHANLAAAEFVDPARRAARQREALHAATHARSALCRYLEDATADIRSMMLDVHNADRHFDFLSFLRRALDAAPAAGVERQAAAVRVCAAAGLLPEDTRDAAGACRGDCFTPLVAACAGGRGADDVLALVAAGADPCAAVAVGAKQRWTALHYAAASGNTAASVALLDCLPAGLRPDPDAPAWDGRTALLYSGMGGWAETAAALAARGATVDAADCSGSTPLIMAAQRGRASAVGALLTARADVDRAQKNGATPLNIAAYYGQTEAVKILCEEGARLDLRDRWGKTALNNAEERGHGEIAQYLRGRGAA